VVDIKHILVVTDLTNRSDRALDRALGLADGCTVTLLHVIVAGLPDALKRRLISNIEAHLAEQAKAVQSRPNIGDIHTAVVTGDPFGTIVREAVTRGADLIVLGEPDRQRREDLFVGSTAERVMRSTDRPVLMVKRAGHGRYDRIAVAFEGSEASMRVLKTALALSPDAEFRVTHAWWPPTAAMGIEDVLQRGTREKNEQIRSEIVRVAKEATTGAGRAAPRLAFNFVEDNPYTVLRHDSDWADLLALGTHSKARLAMSTEIGRLARFMLAEAPCDVLVSPP
jgi:nucleotide-binding universal stress UspA family protein